MDPVVARIERLEKANRRLKRLLIIVAVAVSAVFVMAQTSLKPTYEVKVVPGGPDAVKHAAEINKSSAQGWQVKAVWYKPDGSNVYYALLERMK